MVRKIERRKETNRGRRSMIRTLLRTTEEAMEEGDLQAASAAFKKVEPQIRRGSCKGLFHKKNASRKISRLTKRLTALGAAPTVAAPSATPAPAATSDAAPEDSTSTS